jgi:hypothetical protein
MDHKEIECEDVEWGPVAIINSPVHKRREISLQTEQLSASQKGLCPTELARRKMLIWIRILVQELCFTRPNLMFCSSICGILCYHSSIALTLLFSLVPE